MIPIRCFSCGRVIAHNWDEYKKRTKKGENPEKVLDDLGVKPYCCRRMLISHRDYIDYIMQYKR